jgi:hypothetical protein
MQLLRTLKHGCQASTCLLGMEHVPNRRAIVAGSHASGVHSCPCNDQLALDTCADVGLQVAWGLGRGSGQGRVQERGR